MPWDPRTSPGTLKAQRSLTWSAAANSCGCLCRRTARPPGRRAETAGAAPGLPAVALMAHLGMSGQLLMQDDAVPDEKHLKVRLRLSPRDGMPDATEVRGPAHLRRPVRHLAGPDGRRRPRRAGRGPAAAHRRGSVPHRPRPPRPVLFLRRFSTAGSGAGRPASNGHCWTRAWSPASATSTPTRPCGGPSFTTPVPPTPCGGRTPRAFSKRPRGHDRRP